MESTSGDVIWVHNLCCTGKRKNRQCPVFKYRGRNRRLFLPRYLMQWQSKVQDENINV